MALLGQESAQLREQVDQVRQAMSSHTSVLLLLVVPLKRGGERAQGIKSWVHKHGGLN